MRASTLVPDVVFPNAREVKDAGRFRGAQVERWREAGAELPETTLRRHAVVMTLGPTDALEVRFAGHGAMRGSAQPGALCVTPAGAPYRVRRLRAPQHPPAEMVVVGLEPDFVASVCGVRPVELTPSFAREDSLVAALVGALATELRQGHPSPAVYGDALLVALAAHLGRAPPRSLSGKPERVRQLIHDELHTALRLEALAGVAGCDVRSFTRWFRREFGTSPHRYISAARVERARHRLVDTDAPLGLIALDCGFSSQSHLTTIFRQHTGVTPGAFRRQRRG